MMYAKAPQDKNESQPADDKGAKAMVFAACGRHLLLTLRDCSAELLNDENKLGELTRLAAEATGATVLEIRTHKFSPQGVTALAVLAESHASLHTYPEANVVFWDCFTCGTVCDPQLSVSILVEALEAGSISSEIVTRS